MQLLRCQDTQSKLSGMKLFWLDIGQVLQFFTSWYFTYPTTLKHVHFSKNNLPASVTILTPHAMLQNHPTNMNVTVNNCDTPTHTFTHNVTSLWSSLVCTRHSPQQSIENPLNIVPEINKIIIVNINTHLLEEILNDESSSYSVPKQIIEEETNFF